MHALGVACPPLSEKCSSQGIEVGRAIKNIATKTKKSEKNRKHMKTGFKKMKQANVPPRFGQSTSGSFFCSRDKSLVVLYVCI